MSLLNRIKTFLGFAPALRNKPGGMAWIVDVGQADGSEVLNGRAVRTIRIVEGGFWEIDPPQVWTARSHLLCVATGAFVRAGDKVRTTAIVDSCLEPWKDTGLSKDEVAELYTPRREVLALPVKGEVH